MIEVTQQLMRKALIAYLPREQVIELIVDQLQKAAKRDYNGRTPQWLYKTSNCLACGKETWKR